METKPSLPVLLVLYTEDSHNDFGVSLELLSCFRINLGQSYTFMMLLHDE